MPYFHGTMEENLQSILRHGLGGVDVGATSEDCERGVYLASDPGLCVLVLMMHYRNVGAPDSIPSEHLSRMRVLVIDDSRIDRNRLVPDPQVRRWTGSWLYRGRIDVGGMPTLTVEQVMAGCDTLPPNDWRELPGEAPGTH